MSFPESVVRKAAMLCTAGILTGCSMQPTTAETAGSLIGAAAGAYGGSKIGHGTTPYIAGALGATAGAWLGRSIAGYLSRNAQQLMARATQQAVQSGQPQAWSDPQSKVSGQAEVIRTFIPPKSATIPSINAETSRPCRTVEQIVTLSDGSQRKEQVTACQGPQGWQVI